MKTSISRSLSGMQPTDAMRSIKEKATSNRFFVYALELVLLYVLVFAAVSAFAQEPAKAGKEAGKLEFVKETMVFNSGKVYINWVAKSNSEDCIYVIERSIDGTEYEPVGLKEGIGSPLELLYSWLTASRSAELFNTALNRSIMKETWSHKPIQKQWFHRKVVHCSWTKATGWFR